MKTKEEIACDKAEFADFKRRVERFSALHSKRKDL